MNRSTKKWLLRGVCILAAALLLGAIIWAADGFPRTVRVNWTMQGALTDPQGQVQQTLSLTVQGKIKDYPSKSDVLELDIILPESFHFSFSGAESGISSGYRPENADYYLCSGFAYDKAENAPIFCQFGIDASQEALIIDWDDSQDLYLVAATDPEYSPDSLLAHFQVFLADRAFPSVQPSLPPVPGPAEPPSIAPVAEYAPGQEFSLKMTVHEFSGSAEAHTYPASISGRIPREDGIFPFQLTPGDRQRWSLRENQGTLKVLTAQDPQLQNFILAVTYLTNVRSNLSYPAWIAFDPSTETMLIGIWDPQQTRIAASANNRIRKEQITDHFQAAADLFADMEVDTEPTSDCPFFWKMKATVLNEATGRQTATTLWIAGDMPTQDDFPVQMTFGSESPWATGYYATSFPLHPAVNASGETLKGFLTSSFFMVNTASTPRNYIAHFAMDAEAELVLFRVTDTSEVIVASTDPAIPPEDILAHFRAVTDLWAK